MRARPLACALAALWLALTRDASAQQEEKEEQQKPVAQDEVIEVVGDAPVTETSTVAITARDAARVAGAAGDALKVVGDLPGVARPAAGSGELVIWGSAPEESTIYLDGIELPALYHLGGHRSVIPAPLVGAIELLPGAYGAEYGRSVGGVVAVESADLPAAGTHGALAADLLDSSAFVSTALPGMRAGAGARFGYLDRIAAGAVDQESRALIPIPRYYDGQLRLEIDAGKDARLDIVALGAGDRIDRTVASADPADVRTEATNDEFALFYARYRRRTADGQRSSVTPFVSLRRQRQTNRFGTIATELESDSWRYGVRAEHVQPLGATSRFIIGFDAAASRARYFRRGTLSLPTREGDVAVFGQMPPEDVSADAWRADTVDAAPYTAAEFRRGPFGFRVGARFAAVLLSTSRKLPPVGSLPPVGYTAMRWLPEPRASVTWEPTWNFALRADVGLHHQAPDPSDLSSVFGTPTLEPTRAVHSALGSVVRLSTGTTVQSVLFAKRLTDLPARSDNSMPPRAQALVQDGDGRSYGAQLLVRQQLFSGFSGWLAYTLSRSERRRNDSQSYRLLDFDQTHVLTAVASYQHGPWALGVRTRYATGMPRTPVVGSFYDARSDAYQPIFGEQSSSRLPDFLQLDLRAERGFDLSGFDLRLSLDVLNATNRKNAEEIVYNHDFSQREYLTGLPILAVFGAALTF